MSTNLVICSVAFSLFIIIFVLFLLKKEKVNIKYSIIWLLLFLLLLVALLIPGFMEWVTKSLGFQMASNMVFSLLIGVLVVINISLTIIVSNHDKKIRLLIQEVSLIKGDMKNDK